jgi:hypothetical protein
MAKVKPTIGDLVYLERTVRAGAHDLLVVLAVATEDNDGFLCIMKELFGPQRLNVWSDLSSVYFLTGPLSGLRPLPAFLATP